MLLLTAATPAPNSTVLYVIAAALMGGLLPTLVSAYRRWKRGPIEDEEVVGRIVQGEVAGLKDLLGEYRVEVEVTKRQLEEYRKQLVAITHDLAQAQVRISRLEEELKDSNRNRDHLRRELDRLVEQRDGLTAERDRLQLESDSLRARLQKLEDFAHEVHPSQANERDIGPGQAQD